jgi:hypothetical protein
MKQQKKIAFITKKHWGIIAGLVLVLLTFGVLVNIADQKWLGNTFKDKQSNAGIMGGQKSRVIVEGEVSCLPKTGDGPHTNECAIGIKDSDGFYYAVTGSKTIGFETGKTIKLSGELTPAKDGEVYDVVGTIAADK